MSNNPRITKKELLAELCRLQRENAHLKMVHKLNEGLFEMQEHRLQFFKEMTCLTRQEQECLVPMARFLERLSRCLLLETKPVEA